MGDAETMGAYASHMQLASAKKLEGSKAKNASRKNL